MPLRLGGARAVRLNRLSVNIDALSASERSALPCAPSGHLVRCPNLSGLQTRWARRLQVYIPNTRRIQQAAERVSVLRENAAFTSTGRAEVAENAIIIKTQEAAAGNYPD